MSSLIVESLCDIKYPYRTAPILIEDKVYTIETGVPYSISLLEKPSIDYSIIIPGYTESDYAPSTATSFYVDHTASIIYFSSTEAGKSVAVTYYGIGSPIIAGDVNRFSVFLDNLKAALFSFLVEALSGRRVRLHGGKFVDSITGNTISTKKELFIDFGENGNYQLGLITESYSKKVLVGVDVSTSQIVVVEGTEAPEYEATLIPSYSSAFRPVAIITVTGNKGSILEIAQSDIVSVRNFIS